MSDASEADLQEQHQPVDEDDETSPEAVAVPLEPEVPEADAVEQHLVVPTEDDYDR